MIPGLAALAVLCSALSAARLCRCAQRPPASRAGSTTLEFTLAFPIFLVSVFTAAQAALLMHAQIVVDYAAFAAARSASVWIGSMRGPEALKADETLEDSRARVLRAATIACLPISPTVGQLVSLRSRTVPHGLAAAIRRGAPVSAAAAPSAETLAADMVARWPYASSFTSVTLDSHGDTTCRGTDPRVAVTVVHKYRMPVPFAGPLLARLLGGGSLGIPGEYFVPLTATYSMRRWACDAEI